MLQLSILNLLSVGVGFAKAHNFLAEFGATPQAFSIDVNPSFEEYVIRRVSGTRYVSDDLGVPAFVNGPSVSNATAVGNFWAHQYNWTTEQHHINKIFTQYTTTVDISQFDYTEPIPLHFVHHRSNRTDAIPLLFIHGFPGSFLEVGPMINDLTNPPNDSVPAFHVVAPSIPSYGFSPAPVKPGFGPIEAGHAFNELMLQLNYTRYVIQGGDLGGYILRYQASSHPETVVSVLCNFWIEPPNQTDIARHAQNQTRAEENSWFDFLNTLATKGFMHLYTQKTAPLQAGFAMTDSPIGFTMWIYQVMAGLAPTPYSWRLDEIITWSMMYLIQGPYSAMRFYKEFAAEGAFVGATSFGELPYVHVPVGVIKGGLDVGYYVPLDWAQRRGNITAWYVHDEGVHLAAYQTPESLLSDIWKFFGDPATSGTKEFHTE